MFCCFARNGSFFFNGSGGESRHNAHAVGGRENVLHVSVSKLWYSVLLSGV